MLAYKPQLAAVVGVIALVDLGWLVFAGAAISAGTLVASAAVAMPGIFSTYRAALPRLLHFMQVEHVYMWERHVTLKAFWRLLIQGTAAGDAGVLVTLLTGICAAALGVALLAAAFRCRLAKKCRDVNPSVTRDRLIAATIAAMPLLMPFYFDYDLLLLAIPAVLVAANGPSFIRARPHSADRRLVHAVRVDDREPRRRRVDACERRRAAAHGDCRRARRPRVAARCGNGTMAIVVTRLHRAARAGDVTGAAACSRLTR